MQARILWSLLWRSVLLFPVGALIAFAVVAFPVLMIVLPLGAGLFFLDGSWICGLATLAVMVPVIGARHWLAHKVMNDGYAPFGSL